MVVQIPGSDHGALEDLYAHRVTANWWSGLVVLEFKPEQLFLLDCLVDASRERGDSCGFQMLREPHMWVCHVFLREPRKKVMVISVWRPCKTHQKQVPTRKTSTQHWQIEGAHIKRQGSLCWRSICFSFTEKKKGWVKKLFLPRKCVLGSGCENAKPASSGYRAGVHQFLLINASHKSKPE